MRKAAGIDFAGTDPTTSNLIAEVEMRDEPAWGLRHDALGIHGLSKTESGRVRWCRRDGSDARSHAASPTLRDLSEALVAVYGTDFGLHNPSWISRFTDAARQAASYRKGRVLLAGDAAHIHPPVGGQGLNIGVQDAVNLGWKLAQVVKGTSPESLLDTYHAERHPVGARVLRNTMAQIALLRRDDDRIKAAARHRRRTARAWTSRANVSPAMMSGLDVHYDLGEGHALLGRRMPDLDLYGDGSAATVHAAARRAPLLLDFGEPGGLDIAPWADRVELVDADYDGAWELPVHRTGRGARGRAGAARRACGLGGRREPTRPRGRADEVVRGGLQTSVRSGAKERGSDPDIRAFTVRRLIDAAGLRCHGDWRMR